MGRPTLGKCSADGSVASDGGRSSALPLLTHLTLRNFGLSGGDEQLMNHLHASAARRYTIVARSSRGRPVVVPWSSRGRYAFVAPHLHRHPFDVAFDVRSRSRSGRRRRRRLGN